MAFLFCDSFDKYGTSASVAETGYDSAFITLSLSTSIKRTGTHSLTLSTSNWIESTINAPIAASGSTAIVGVGLYIDAVGTGGAIEFIQIKEGATVHMTLALTRTGASSGQMKMAVYRGDAVTLLGTSTYEVADDTWYYIEFKTTIHDTTGAYEVRVDGVNRLSASGVDTRNGATGVFNTFRVSCPVNGSNNTFIDDLYVLDGSGGSMNDFLGPQSIQWLVAQSGDGSNADWTPSTGGDNGAMVDENTPDADSTYNTSTTVGHKDTYNLANLTLTGTIRGVQSVLRMRKTDASARTIKTVFRSNGTDYDQTEQEVLTTYSNIVEPRATDPDTSAAWTSSAVNALEVGPKVFS